MLAEVRTMAGWLRMLDQVDATLTRSLAGGDEPDAAAPPSAPGAAEAALRRVVERQATAQARLDAAASHADALDAELGKEADASRAWIEGLAAARKRLMDGARGEA
jgi:hypothetical protein